ncbi:MAG TPA: MFS transporter, partial [Mucilaginibacter sp.]
SANVGDQFDHKNQHLMSSIYGWFYFSINAGSMFSLALIPVVYEKAGAKWAFGIPGILMALATFIFFSGRKRYIRLPARGIKKDNFVAVNLYVLAKYFGKKDTDKTAWQTAEIKYGVEKVEAIKSVWSVLAVFAFIPAFWGLWDMNGSEWIIQATKLDLNTGIFDFHILPSQIQTVNAIFLLAFIPIFNYGVYPLVELIGFRLTALRKIGAGLFITGLSFVIIAFLQHKVDAGLHPSVWWQIFAFAMLSAGEVLVSITGLEYAYTQSPPSMKSTLTALFYLTYAVGTFFTTLINVNISNKGIFAYFTGEKYYWLFVGIMLFFFVLFLFVSPRIREKAYLAGDLIGDGLNIKDDKTQEIHPDNPIV